jgi:hypothetical protein
MIQEQSGWTSRQPRPTRLSRLAVVLCLGIAGGCGSRDPWNRQAVSGVVTLDGHALDEGAILLEPLAKSGWGMAVGATIWRGSFAIRRDQGPPPGAYRVRVYSSSSMQAPPGKEQTEHTRRPMVERLAEIYNTRSELRIDVVAGGSNRLQLNLRGDGGR